MPSPSVSTFGGGGGGGASGGAMLGRHDTPNRNSAYDAASVYGSRLAAPRRKRPSARSVIERWTRNRAPMSRFSGQSVSLPSVDDDVCMKPSPIDANGITFGWRSGYWKIAWT